MLPVGKNNIFRRLLFNLLYPIVQLYLSKERMYCYKDINVKVFPGVFHPGLFFSTKILLNYLQKIDLKNKNVLELGAGSGMLSIYSAKQGAIVTGSDISRNAKDNLRINAELNNVELKIINSNLFDEIPRQSFDMIIINPPYFPKDPKSEKEYAWFCGNDFEFFKKMFEQLPGYINSQSEVVMNLSEDCDIEVIKNIAAKNEFEMKEIYKERVWSEWNFLFKINQANAPVL